MITAVYQALYRKYRPRTFDEVVGQAHITDTLKRQVSMGRLSHAYLFTGTRGTGKTTCAKILARAVNCEAPVDGNPCNRCKACTGIESGSVLDVLELDAASNNGVDQVRALRDEAVYTPAAVKKRVYIVDEVHMLSTPAFNALLKILEEPPSHLMFILATTELHKVPATIKSRCQQFAFGRIAPQEIEARLLEVAGSEDLSLTPEGARLLARLADGGLRDALSLLDQCMTSSGSIGEQEIFDTLGLMGNLQTAQLLARIAQGDAAGVLQDFGAFYTAGKEVGSLLGELSALARDLLVFQTAAEGGGALLTGGYDDETMRSLSSALPSTRLLYMLDMLQQAQAGLAYSVNRRVDAELCLMRLCDATLSDGQSGVLARLERLEGLCSGTVPPPAPRDAASQKEAVPAMQKMDTAQPPTPQAEPKPVRAQEVLPSEKDVWSDMLPALKNKVPMSEYVIIKEASRVQGRLKGDSFTFWVDSEMTQGILRRGKLIEATQALLHAMTGRDINCTFSVGKAPALPVQAQKEAPAPAHDKLDDLLAFGQQFDNIIITE
ncbi:MAG: DNA polymerase III subunit gamma/tau [Oscillospiraceae bacterium]|nr:DNA polymerase III subunit gamma/tau [Oscillospiraceae bacterium]